MRRGPLLLAVQTALVAGILACVVLIAHRHPWRLDLTPEKRFTLAPHTREVLARLRDDVTVTGFYSGQDPAMRQDLADLLALYEDASPRVHARLLDLDRSPGAAERLRVHTYNVVVVEVGERRERVDLTTEERITSAILRVAGTPPVPTYVVRGHGECDPRDDEGRGGSGQGAEALAADGFDLRVVEGAAALPDDAGLVIVAGPTRDLAPSEVAAIDAHVRRGGSLLALVDPPTPPSVARLLRGFGVELGNDVVVDEQGRLLGTDGLAARIAFLNQSLVPQAPEVNAILPIAQSLRLVEGEGVRAEYLGVTAESTWADVDRRSLGNGETHFRPDVDRRGPLPVAALARVDAGQGREGRVVVVGDADFGTNLHLGVLGNRDFLLVAAELATRADAYTAARPPVRSTSTFSSLALTAREARLVLWLAAIVPALVCAGVAAATVRRRRFA
ncbi:MAG TPA: GldG family protein [Candidatus Eisenbacteria bacterium]|nr:GldG family protein [Candidatus Eisenbacteria bacterium]